MTRPVFGATAGLWDIDGALRDIYVFETDIVDWEKFIDFSIRYPCEYLYDGVVGDVPALENVFKNREGSHLLSIHVGGITVNCHFFVMSEIELDLDPKEVQDAKAHEQVLSFIESLAVAMGKRIVLAPENCSDLPYSSYEPMMDSWDVCF